MLQAWPIWRLRCRKKAEATGGNPARSDGAELDLRSRTLPIRPTPRPRREFPVAIAPSAPPTEDGAGASISFQSWSIYCRTKCDQAGGGENTITLALNGYGNQDEQRAI